MEYPYFKPSDSAAYVYGSDPRDVLPLIAARYMGDNPEMPFILRTFDETGIAANTRGQYIFNFGERFPTAPEGSYVYAVGDLYCPAAKTSNFTVGCMGPVKIYLNGQCVFTSGGPMEGNVSQLVPFGTKLEAGFNRFVIRCECTSIGFGCLMANAMPQWEPCNYVMPFEDRAGEAGWLYTQPTDCADLGEGDTVWGSSESACYTDFLPGRTRTAANYCGKDGIYYLYTAISLDCSCSVEFKCAGSFLIDGEKGGNIMSLKRGVHKIAIRANTAVHPSDAISVILPDKSCAELILPAPVKGECGKYLLAGPFSSDTQLSFAELTDFSHTFACSEGESYWHSAYENIVIRPYVESALFGRWTYPLGVTLYGLLRSGQWLGRDEYCTYVRHHVDQVVNIHKYALYDKAKYGFPGVNQQAAWLDALDDCGSFGSLMLECSDAFQNPESRPIADLIAAYIRDEQPRTDDGAFKRRDESMWADDMYMSVPFLARYGKLSGDGAFFDDAANQLLLFKKHLFIPQKGVMSHMKSLPHGKKNEIPWCRGNGWVIFALSELLMKLPKEHEKRNELTAFYNELVRGYLALQDESGLWHQILDDKISYLESSATAMFICAFSRGIISDYIDHDLRDKAISAIERAWDGLTKYIIDRGGNIYGVCRGSSFSFSRHYYRSLSWNYNDTHGTGIIMLAGVELYHLREYLK